jgi:uncharacterized spore protein YtfJ
MGFGSGEDEKDNDSGNGGGGGGGGHGRPVAAIVVTPDDVHVKPILDVTKIALAGLTTLAFVVSWTARLKRSTRKEPSFKEAKRAIQS